MYNVQCTYVRRYLHIICSFITDRITHLRAAQYELAARIDMVNGAIVQVFGRDNHFHDLLHDVFT